MLREWVDKSSEPGYTRIIPSTQRKGVKKLEFKFVAGGSCTAGHDPGKAGGIGGNFPQLPQQKAEREAAVYPGRSGSDFPRFGAEKPSGRFFDRKSQIRNEKEA